jgi:hypothetical protein
MFTRREKPLAPRNVRAIHSYTAQHESELSFREGDELCVLDESFGWLEGVLHGQRGWFPHDHVEDVAPTVAQEAVVEPPKPAALDDSDPGTLIYFKF